MTAPHGDDCGARSGSVRVVLDSIFGSQASASAKRRLAALAVQAAIRPAVEAVATANDAIHELEGALAAARQGASLRKQPSVSEAKYILRQRGPQGRELAARIGRLSQQRNGQARPDSGLEDDIGVLFGELEGAESFYSTAAGSATPPRTPAPQGPSASPRPPARPADTIFPHLL